MRGGEGWCGVVRGGTFLTTHLRCVVRKVGEEESGEEGGEEVW